MNVEKDWEARFRLSERPPRRWIWYLLLFLVPIEFIPYSVQIAFVATILVIAIVVFRKRRPTP